MSWAKVGIATGAAGAAGGVAGGIYNSDNRLEGAARGAAFAGGLIGGGGALYKGIGMGLSRVGYKEAPQAVQDQLHKDMGDALMMLYKEANGPGAQGFLEAAKGVPKGTSRYGQAVAEKLVSKTGATQTSVAQGLNAAGAVGNSMEYFGRAGGGFEKYSETFESMSNKIGTNKVAMIGAQLGMVAKSSVDMTYNMTMKPTVDLFNNIKSGNFKNIGLNQVTSLASNGYGAYSVGAATLDAANGDYDSARGHLGKALAANALQMKSGAAVDAFKAYRNNNLSMKGIWNTMKVSKYSSRFNQNSFIDGTTFTPKVAALPA